MALCLAFLFTPLLSKAQTVDTTGNLVNFTNQATSTTSTWQNAGSIGQPLTCWQGGDPGYCGPLPRVAAWGSGSNVINFSYGLTNLNQIVNVNNALASAGTGLQVNGFNFSFQAKNGNGWDNGMQDYLTAYVNIYNNTNSKVLEAYNYDLNRKYNWTQFNYSETFKTPYAAPNVGNAVYGFIGKDNNFWVGPYGPEITAVNFSLKYSVDPCASNVLSSPTCSGYFEALAKLAPTPVAPAIITEAALPPPVVESGPVTMTGQPAPLPGSPPPPPPGSTAPQDSSQPQPQQGGPSPAGAPLPGPVQQASVAQPTANNPQPKVGEVSDSGGGSKTTVSLSSVLNMISSNQDKTAALEKSVVQAADAQAFSAGETAKQTAEKIAGDAQSQSVAIAGSQATSLVQTSFQSGPNQLQTGSFTLQGNLQSNTVLNSSRTEQSIASGSNQSTNSNSTSTTQQSNQGKLKQDMGGSTSQFVLQSPRYEPPKVESMGIQTFTQGQYQPPIIRQETIIASVAPITPYSLIMPTRQVQQVQIEMPSLEGIKFGHKGPVDNAMESKPFLPQMNTGAQQSDTVKKNVQNNELAGGVSIESIAKMPTNYAQYFTAIPDAAFYEPKEIYKNQKNVDNARALRQLSSDRLHQEMVNQQYKLGN